MTLQSAFGLRQYKTMGLQGVVAEASRHELIRLMMDGCLDRIAAARGQIARAEMASKGMSIGRAISIIEVLRTSLDLEAGGKTAANLDSLYDYMVRQLSQANLANDSALLDEVETLLAQIRDGWTAIGNHTDSGRTDSSTQRGADAAQVG